MDFKNDKFWEIVDKAYDCDGLIWLHVDKPNEEHGDGLAKFIVRELEEAGDLDEAIGMMERSVAQVNAVVSALSTLRKET